MSNYPVGTPGALPQPTAIASYLGQGVSYPLAYNPNTGRLNLSIGQQSVADALAAIFSTQPGERVMQPDFGCDVGTFEPIDPIRLKQKALEVVAAHEPRVMNLDVQVDTIYDTGTQMMRVSYEIVGSATTQVLTFPYYTPLAPF